MRWVAFVLLAVVIAIPALAQDFAGGYELVVRQHPTDADPEAIVEIWGWTDLECATGRNLVGSGMYRLILSHPILEQGFTSDVWLVCKIARPSIPPGPCDTFGWLQVGGVEILPFAFTQNLETLSFDNPLHIMDVHMIVQDLTPRDVTIGTHHSRLYVGCGVDGDVFRVEETIPVTDGQTTILVNGGACRADLDGDGTLTIFDFLEFQNLFADGDPRADFDGDGELTLFDFLEFQNAFAAGC